MRILALVPGGIGDQIYFFPTLETLHSKYPDAKIDVLVEPQAKKAYRVCQYVSEVLLFDYQDRSSMADYLNLLGVIRDREFESVISYNAPWFVEFLLWLNGIPVRVGEQKSNSWIFSNSISLQKQQYAPKSYHDILQAFGVTSTCPDVKINVPQQDIDWAEARQKLLDLKNGYILLHGKDETYPVAKWHQIIEDLQSKQPEISIVLLQTKEEDAWISAVMETSASLKVIAPSDVGKTAAIIAGSNLFLSCDRNTIALAVAVGTYTVSLLDTADVSQQMLPQNSNLIAVCSPSSNIADIPVESVLNKIWGE